MKQGYAEHLVKTLEAQDALLAEAEESLRAIKPLAKIQGLRLLRLGQGRMVFGARLEGKPVVIKQIFGPGAKGLLAGIRAEYQTIEPHMTEDLRLAKQLLLRPGKGVLVMREEEGAPVQTLLSYARPKLRHRVIETAGQWLSHYAAPRQKQAEFGPWFWVRARAGMEIGALPTQDQDLITQGMAHLRQAARHLAGQPVRQAAVHWDFQPHNLLWEDGRLCALDPGPETWMAQSRAVARFLVGALDLTDRPQKLSGLGVFAEDLKAMKAAGVLPKGEAKTILPFFVLDALIERVARGGGSAARADLLRAALQTHLR